jgi:hypothetical protein
MARLEVMLVVMTLAMLSDEELCIDFKSAGIIETILTNLIPTASSRQIIHITTLARAIAYTMIYLISRLD